MSHLGETLVNGGKLIITTRGLSQVAYLRALHAAAGPLDSFAAMLPSPDVVERRYRNGDFQYYPLGGGGGELTDDFYGESWIAESWMKERYRRLGFSRYEFLPESGVMDQCTFILTK